MNTMSYPGLGLRGISRSSTEFARQDLLEVVKPAFREALIPALPLPQVS
jgi:hypothetical protein